jgi:hypothetical protein
MADQPQCSIDLTQSDDEDDEVTDLTKLPESDDDIFAGPATHQVQAHKKAAAKKTDVTDLTRSSDDEEAAAKKTDVTDLTRSSDDEKPAAPIDLSPAVVIGVVGLPTTVLDTTTARYGPPPMPSVAAAAFHGLQQKPMSLHGQRIVMGGSASGSRTVMPHTSPQAVASLASAGGQTIVTAAPAQGAAGGAASVAASVGGMNVLMSGGFGAASSATESDDEAPIPTMASTSPQAVASCARMRVEPIDNSASSEKPGKALCKGKQKAADGIGGSAQERKPNARSAAKPTETEPCAGTTAAKKQKKRKWHATVKDRRWISDVEAWFAEKQREFKWLNIDELEAATVDLMIQMESDEIRACMADCLKKRAVELNMHVFNKVLQGGLK